MYDNGYTIGAGKFLSNEFLARSEDGSGNRLETPGQGNNMEEERFPVQGSDFQLIEETEKAETEGGSDKGPVHAIGIRTFKTLEIIRRESQKKASNVEGAVSQPYITTVSNETHLFYK